MAPYVAADAGNRRLSASLECRRCSRRRRCALPGRRQTSRSPWAGRRSVAAYAPRALRRSRHGCRAVRDSTLVAWYRSLTHLAREGRMTVTIGRRELLAALGGAAAAWPLAVRAQPPTKLPTIGFQGAINATCERASTDAFVQRLRELGWIENRTVAIEYRWAEGRDERFAEIAAEFIRLKVDVIFTYGTPSSIAAKKATAVIPIVFAATGDPVGTGLVASLARPGGNITGLSIQQTDLAGKRLEMLRELIPNLRTVAILFH